MKTLRVNLDLRHVIKRLTILVQEPKASVIQKIKVCHFIKLSQIYQIYIERLQKQTFLKHNIYMLMAYIEVFLHLKKINKASEYGSSEAIHNLGLMYQQGLGVTKDMEKAFLLYNLSVASGYAPAKRTLGLWYILNGEITKGTELVNAPKIKKTFIGAKPQEILIWSKKLAETEDPIFMYRYALSLGENKQYEDAINWAKKSADSGVASAMHFLGLIYYSTTNFKDINLAREYFQKARLHIGGKKADPEWEIFDALERDHVDHVGNAADLSRFSDGEFQTIYASHVLEHFPYLRHEGVVAGDG